MFQTLARKPSGEADRDQDQRRRLDQQLGDAAEGRQRIDEDLVQRLARRLAEQGEQIAPATIVSSTRQHRRQVEHGCAMVLCAVQAGACAGSCAWQRQPQLRPCRRPMSSTVMSSACRVTRQPAVGDDRDARGDGQQLVEVLRDRQHRGAGGRQIDQRLMDGRRCAGVHTPGRLRYDENGWVLHHLAADHELLQVAARERLRRLPIRRPSRRSA